MTQTPPISAEQVEAVKALEAACNQARLALAGMVSVQSAMDMLDCRPLGVSAALTAAASIPARGVETGHDWAGGNNTCYCRRCGIEYAYGKEPKPLGDCLASPAPLPVQEQIEPVQNMHELVGRLNYMVGNPSAWQDGFDEGASELMREAAVGIGAAEAKVERLTEALKVAARRFDGIRSAVETNQVVDKDVHGTAISSRDNALQALGDTP